MIAAWAVAVAMAGLQQGDSLSLQQALAQAHARRGGVAAAHYVVAAARAQKRIATAPPNPVLQYYQKETAPEERLTVDQRFDWLLRWPSERAAGLAGIVRAEADSSQRVANVAREVRYAFYGALAAREQLRVTSAQASLADTLDLLATRRLDAGEISAVEKERFTLEAARVRRELSVVREGYQAALAEFARATAWREARVPEPSGSLAEQLDAEPDTARPDVMIPLLSAAIADSARSARQLSSVRWSMIPIPSLFAGRERDNPTSGDRRLTAIFGLSLPLPLWSQRREYEAEARAQANLRAAELAEVRTQTTRLLIESRGRLVESAVRARSARDVLLPSAQRIRAQTVRLYDAGRVSMLEVFDALRSERDVASTTIADLLAYQRALADWYALLGRFQ